MRPEAGDQQAQRLCGREAGEHEAEPDQRAARTGGGGAAAADEFAADGEGREPGCRLLLEGGLVVGGGRDALRVQRAVSDERTRQRPADREARAVDRERRAA